MNGGITKIVLDADQPFAPRGEMLREYAMLRSKFGIGIVGMDVSGGANQLALVRAVLFFL